MGMLSKKELVERRESKKSYKRAIASTVARPDHALTQAATHIMRAVKSLDTAAQYLREVHDGPALLEQADREILQLTKLISLSENESKIAKLLKLTAEKESLESEIENDKEALKND